MSLWSKLFGRKFVNEKKLIQAVIDNDENAVEKLLSTGQLADEISTMPIPKVKNIEEGILRATAAAAFRTFPESSAQVTPLVLCCYRGNVNVANMLISAGADVNKPDGYGVTPLISASRQGNAMVVNLLIKSGANVNKAESEYFESPLILAAKYNHLACVKLLVEHGANINYAKPNTGDAALTFAEKKGHEEVFQFLRSSNAVA